MRKCFSYSVDQLYFYFLYSTVLNLYGYGSLVKDCRRHLGVELSGFHPKATRSCIFDL